MKRFGYGILLLTGLITGLVSPGYSEVETMGRSYFIFGINRVKLNQFNRVLNDTGYPKFSDSLTSIGGAGWGMEKRLVLGGEGYYLKGQERNIEGYTLSLAGGAGFFNIGYLLFSGSHLNLYPVVGIGGGRLSFDITGEQTETFDNILHDPGKSVSLKTGGFLLNFSLTVDYLVPVFEGIDELGEETGLAVGLRVGYVFDPTPGDWTANKIANITGGPELGITGPYIQLLLGPGSNTR